MSNLIKTEYVDPTTLKFAKYNPRFISDDAMVGLMASITEFGIVDPFVVNKRNNTIVGGHMRCRAAIEMEIKKVPVVYVDLPLEKEKALNLSLNNQHIAGDFTAGLQSILKDIKEVDLDLYNTLSLDALLADIPEIPEPINPGGGDPDKTPDVAKEPVVKIGDLVRLGKHRLLCGDSTKKEDVERVMGGEKAILLHADPPYGMGKERDGVTNDNLYKEKLDIFQMQWWKTIRPYLQDNASAYIWGNSDDLFRLWYCGGLKVFERITFRNEIVWDKGGGGMSIGTEAGRMYQSSERCLFFMLGEQGFSTNADNYWEGWEPIRKYLKDELKKVGDIKWAKRVAGHSEKSGCHWFDNSQWTMPTKEVYESWQVAAKNDAFKRDYDDLKRDYYATRAYFDNTHENMTDIWQYPRVQGEERHGHATPKPVEMISRAIKSSCHVGDIVIEPFLGSGSTLIACETTSRTCRGIEIDPGYIQVCTQRWIDFTGRPEDVTVERDGKEFGWEEIKTPQN